MSKTGLMDNGGGQSTYEVPLKGGLISYNITDINGTEVMHYFKRELDNEETKIKIKGEEYNLEMNVPEFKKFKVENLPLKYDTLFPPKYLLFSDICQLLFYFQF